MNDDVMTLTDEELAEVEAALAHGREIPDDLLRRLVAELKRFRRLARSARGETL